MENNWIFLLIKGAVKVSGLTGFTFLSVNLDRAVDSLSAFVKSDSFVAPQTTDGFVTDSGSEPTTTPEKPPQSTSSSTTQPAASPPAPKKTCKQNSVTQNDIVKLTYYNHQKGKWGKWYVYKKQAKYQVTVSVKENCSIEIKYSLKSKVRELGWNYVGNPQHFTVRYKFKDKYYFGEASMKTKLESLVKVEENNI